MRDSFTIPKDEYAVIDALKERAVRLSAPSKSELLRAGLKLLAGLSDTALFTALESVPSIKTGRPTKEPEATAQVKPGKAPPNQGAIQSALEVTRAGLGQLKAGGAQSCSRTDGRWAKKRTHRPLVFPGPWHSKILRRLHCHQHGLALLKALPLAQPPHCPFRSAFWRCMPATAQSPARA